MTKGQKESPPAPLLSGHWTLDIGVLPCSEKPLHTSGSVKSIWNGADGNDGCHFVVSASLTLSSTHAVAYQNFRLGSHGRTLCPAAIQLRLAGVIEGWPTRLVSRKVSSMSASFSVEYRPGAQMSVSGRA